LFSGPTANGSASVLRFIVVINVLASSILGIAFGKSPMRLLGILCGHSADGAYYNRVEAGPCHRVRSGSLSHRIWVYPYRNGSETGE
jgi:hypothetical protein